MKKEFGLYSCGCASPAKQSTFKRNRQSYSLEKEVKTNGRKTVKLRLGRKSKLENSKQCKGSSTNTSENLTKRVTHSSFVAINLKVVFLCVFLHLLVFVQPTESQNILLTPDM